jgi:hypothetical protein
MWLARKNGYRLWGLNTKTKPLRNKGNFVDIPVTHENITVFNDA